MCWNGKHPWSEQCRYGEDCCLTGLFISNGAGGEQCRGARISTKSHSTGVDLDPVQGAPKIRLSSSSTANGRTEDGEQ